MSIIWETSRVRTHKQEKPATRPWLKNIKFTFLHNYFHLISLRTIFLNSPEYFTSFHVKRICISKSLGYSFLVLFCMHMDQKHELHAIRLSACYQNDANCAQGRIWKYIETPWKRTDILHVQYIPRNMHTVFALLCFVVVIHWLIFSYPSGLLHWHCGNLTIAPVPAKQPWWIWINTSSEFIMNDCITTTKQSTTKPCAYFLGYTVMPCQVGIVNNSTPFSLTLPHFIWHWGVQNTNYDIEINAICSVSVRFWPNNI